jgi:hypothetical protein
VLTEQSRGEENAIVDTFARATTVRIDRPQYLLTLQSQGNSGLVPLCYDSLPLIENSLVMSRRGVEKRVFLSAQSFFHLTTR